MRVTVNLRDDGPYATAEDSEIASELGITVKKLRKNRAKQDLKDCPSFIFKHK